MKRKHEIRCNYCGSPAILKPASEIFHDPKQKGYVYVCSHYPACDAYVSAHDHTHLPMGTLANGDLRHKRILAHRALQHLCKSRHMEKREVYIWLQSKLGLNSKQTHIGQFSDWMCDEVIRLCQQASVPFPASQAA